PNLGLHSAASSGNLGLVTYAIDHGQPVNSVLDGVLPLHVASSGGNDLIVRLLIERGADVNAPRLPRKYSSDRHRDASAPIVGTSGATPLHFAAANGHENVVHTLLLHGAHPCRADKHGVTPEMLARQNGWTRCADLLSQWTHEMDKDLREREVLGGAPAPEAEPSSRLELLLECKVAEKKIKVKRSIDNALHMLRPGLPTPPTSGQLQSDASYTTSPPPMTEKTFSDNSSDANEPYPRRPSLPHIFDPAPYMHSSPQSHGSHHHTKSSGRPSFSSSRRPRSAGTDAEPSASTSSTPGRLRGKISLLHMFKKSAGDSPASTAGLPATPDSRESLSGYASSSSALTSASASPAPERDTDRSRIPSSQSPLRARASESGLLSSASGSPYLTTIPSSRSRLTSESAPVAEPFQPPLAVELHRKLSAERLRARSGSGSSSNGTTEGLGNSSSPRPSQQALPSQSSLQGHRSPPTRPGILRPHHRSTSSGQSQPPPVPQLQPEGSMRSLRFDSTASPQPISSKRSALSVKVCNSVNSLRGRLQGGESPRSPRYPSTSRQNIRESPSFSDSVRRVPSQAVDDDEEEGYGEVISPRLGLGLALPEGKSRLNELRTERPRRPSAGSQMSHDSSPVPSPTAAQGESAFDCPFSINRPPPQSLPSDGAPSHSSRPNLLGIHGVDNRGRGDSIGSMSTSTDASASAPQTPLPTAGSALGLGLQIRSPEALLLDLPASSELPLVSSADESDKDKARSRTDSSVSGVSGLSEMSPRLRAAHPLDIDIRAISSHAQAEALVQRAQKSILEMEDGDLELPGLLSSAGSTASATTGGASARTPLSAKLAAYGETLAIERRFKEREREMGRSVSKSADGETPFGSPTTPSGRSPGAELRPRHSERGLRKFSLEERPAEFRAPRRSRPRRPHTADGKFLTHPAETSGLTLGSLGDTQDPSPGFLSASHKPSLSGSAVLFSRSSSSADENHQMHARVASTPSSARTLPAISTPSPARSPPRIVRSRTPDPASRYLAASPSFQNPSPATFGVPLSRVSTAPPRHASPDIIVSERERERARANKLMKMGLAAHDAFPRTQSPYGHVRNGGGSGGSGGVGVGKQRFGGIRGFVQTLTGKS
ncbi:Ankyrin-2, partial [Trametes pubescens]